jgi:hypothetical protein
MNLRHEAMAYSHLLPATQPSNNRMAGLNYLDYLDYLDYLNYLMEVVSVIVDRE